jgi:Transposase IS66 family
LRRRPLTDLRVNHPAADTLPCDAARLCRTQSAGHDPVREVRPASALNRQSERYRREGIDLCLSTLADLVGACTSVLQPLHALIEAHVLAAERLHGDDTTIPILAKGQTIKGHIWTYVRDDRPFGGRALRLPAGKGPINFRGAFDKEN